MVLVTHKLGEVIAHADRVTVMRGGKTVSTADPRAVSVPELTRMIVGSDGHRGAGAGAGTSARRSSRVEGLSGARADGHVALTGASFVGPGRRDLRHRRRRRQRPDRARRDPDGRAASRCRAASTSTGPPTSPAEGPQERRAQGLAFIPADRYTYGLAGGLSVAENYGVSGVLAGQLRLAGLGSTPARIRAATRTAVEAFDVQGVRSPAQKAALLSGGNAQKLVIAREFAGSPRVVLAHSPSRGLDVRASAAVHERLRVARDDGAGVLLISEDLDEILLLVRPGRRDEPRPDRRRVHRRRSTAHADRPGPGAPWLGAPSSLNRSASYARR